MNASRLKVNRSNDAAEITTDSTVPATAPICRVRGCPRRIVWLLMFAIGCSFGHADERPLAEQPVEATIYVDAHHANASDGNPGTRNRPVLTLTRGLSLAGEYL